MREWLAHAWWFWSLAGYLCGSVPVGYLIGRARGVDVREQGSGNIGATNVGRVLGRRFGILCFILDVLKGALPVVAAGWAMGLLGVTRYEDQAQAWQWLTVAVTAVFGHVYPVWLRFRGGKGVATGLGVLLGFWPVLTLPGVAAAVTWALTLAVFRYVSLASVVAASALPVFLVAGAVLVGVPLTEVMPFIVVSALLALLVVLRHRGNFGRLVRGTEPKIGRPRPASD